MHLSYIASILFTHVEITRQWNWVYRYQKPRFTYPPEWTGTVVPLPQNNAWVTASGAFYADGSMTTELSFLGDVKTYSRHIIFFLIHLSFWWIRLPWLTHQSKDGLFSEMLDMELSTSKLEGRESSGRSDFWDHFGGQALVMIGGWYSRHPLTNLLANPNNPTNRYPERLYAFSV